MAALRSLDREPAWMSECEVIREQRVRDWDLLRDEMDAERLRENYAPAGSDDAEGAPE